MLSAEGMPPASTEPGTSPENRLEQALRAALPAGRVKVGELHRGIYGRDASFYEYRPQAVARVLTLAEVQAVLAVARTRGVPVTFRAAGTSLCGQTLGTGIVAEVPSGWGRAEVRDGGGAVWFEPGITVARVNELLEPLGRQLGPDPESGDAARMGGVLANNSGGQQSGIDADPYSTLLDVQFVLANGHRYDIASEEDRERFARDEQAISQGLIGLRDRVRGDAQMVARIRRKYRIKNVMGYGLRGFLDAEEPIDILGRLLMGSEGTLAFIASATLKTVPLHPHWSVGLLFFPTVAAAVVGVRELVNSGATTAEFMDRACLRAWGDRPGVPGWVAELSPDAAAVLVEYRAATPAAIEGKLASAAELIGGFGLVAPATLSADARTREEWFALRAAMFPLVAATRPLGTSVVIEDVAVPPERLTELMLGLRNLFERHGHGDTGFIFGHLATGNVHFIVLADLREAEGVRRLDAFIEDLVDLVLRLDGSLKAEHGTGRAMAPFLVREWGEAAVGVMWEIKRLLDPLALLNPGVLLSRDSHADVGHMKRTPSIGDGTVDRCVECGFCERVCPSRDLTLTPRQRIAAKRVGVAHEEDGELGLAAAVWKDFEYAGRDTCVADGLCGTVCPAGINVAYLTDHERAEAHGSALESAMDLAARHFTVVEKVLRAAVGVGCGVNSSTGRDTMGWATAAGRRLLPDLPQWSRSITKAPPLVSRTAVDPAFVYFPACVNRIMGSSALGKKSVMETVLDVADRAGLRLRLPADSAGICCGQIWLHKGFRRGHAVMANRIVEAFWQWSEGGRIPILCDVTSCVRTVLLDIACEQFGPREQILTDLNLERHAQLKVIDLAEWLHDDVLPRIEVTRKKRSVVVHPTCVCTELGLNAKIEAIAAACAEEVTVPKSLGCCGSGGDRGLLYPELAVAAMAEEAREIAGREFDGAYSLGKTCEIVLSDQTGYTYESIAYLVHEVTAECRSVTAKL